MRYKKWKRLYTSDHSGYLIYENNLGVLHRLTGDYDKALEVLSNTYKKHVKVFGKEDSYTLNCLENLANVYRDMKQFDEAIKYYEEVKEIRKKTEGESDTYAGVLGLCADVFRMKYG